MKRLLLLTVLVLASTIYCQLYAQGATSGFDMGGSSSSNTKTVCINNVYYSLSGTSSSAVTSATVTSVDKNATDIYIPSSVTYNSTSYQVRNISSNAFKGCTELALISIDATWAYTLSRNMFDDCVNLRSIKFSSIFSNRECSNDGILYYSGGLGVYICPIDYKAEVIIPATVNGTNVTSLAGEAFKNCRNVESISIPQYVTSFTGGFEGCDKLTTLEVAAGNTKYCSDNGVVYSQGMTSIIAYPNAKEENYVTPSSVNSISSMAFAYSTKQRNIEIGENVKSISSTAFKGCTKTVITLKSKVGYEDYSFLSDLGEGCVVYMHGKFIDKAKTYYNGTINSIEDFWIVQSEEQKYLGAASFEIKSRYQKENDTEISEYLTLKKIKINEKTYDIPSNNTLYVDGLCPDSVYKAEIIYEEIVKKLITKAVIGKQGNIIISKTITDSIETKKATLVGKIQEANCGALKCSITASSDESLSPSEIGVFCKETNTKYKSDNEAVVDKLIPNTNYTVYPYAIYNGKEIIGNSISNAKTGNPLISVNSKVTQTTITITGIEVSEDGTATPFGMGVELGDKSYPFGVNDIVIASLIPNKEYYFYPYAIYQGKKVYGSIVKIKTKGASPSISTFVKTSTSFHCTANYNLGDAHLKSAEFVGYNTEDNTLHLYGLNPNASYTIKFIVRTQEGSEETTTCTFKTNPLTLTTEQPKVVSMGNVIVSATTNVDADEKNVGFEWRRTDWTSDFASNSGNAVIFDNTMEGYIRNLNTDKLWKYRAYYLSDAGVYYYGDWVGLDASNTSYFEPTVHTYADISTTGNVALIRGYVLNGTDKIKVQGFKYWKTANKGNSLDIDIEGDMQATAIPADAITKTVDIVGSGQQLMNATLEGLDYDATYHCVAFATTTENETFYGEEQMFTTESITGIEGVKESAAGSSKAVTVVAYYDLNGKRLSQPLKGLNIIRMSDGTTRKIVSK